MIIKDGKLLSAFRAVMRCERCGAYRDGSEPHHLFSRGMGGGTRLDVPINLIALCHECHMGFHEGKVSRESLIAAVARREHITVAELTERIRTLQRA